MSSTMLMQTTVSVLYFKCNNFLRSFDHFICDTDDVKTLDEMVEDEFDTMLDANSPYIQYIGNANVKRQ